MGDRLPLYFLVSVVGGFGAASIPGVGGRARAVGLIAPRNGKPDGQKAKYDITGVDGDGFVLYFGDDVEGNINMEVSAQLHDTHSVIITDASRDGLYRGKIWF